MKNVRIRTKLLLVLGCCLPALATSAMAQTPDPDQIDEPITVLGSRIARTQQEGPAPITVINADTIRANGYTSVPDILRDAVGPWVRRALEGHGLRVADVGGWAIHPGGPRVLDAVCAALDLPAGADEHSRAVLRDHGNMSSATLLFILRRMRSAGLPRPWVGLAFGPGLVGELVLLR